MKKLLKIVAFAVGGLLLVLALAVVAVYFFFDINAYKPRIEKAASDALGMEVNIGGRVYFTLYPVLHIGTEELSIRNRKTDIAIAKYASLGLDPRVLLDERLRIGSITLKQASLDIRRFADGSYNFDTPAAGDNLPVFDLSRLRASGLTVKFQDARSGFKLEATACDADLRGLRLAGDARVALVTRLTFTAAVGCDTFTSGAISMSNVTADIAMKDGIIEARSINLALFDGQGSGEISADFSTAVPQYDLRIHIDNLRVETVAALSTPEKLAEGRMNATVALVFQGSDFRALLQTAKGGIHLRSDGLVLHGTNLNREIDRFESSQTFNIADAGAFLLAGPLGLAVTKGYDFGRLLKRAEGQSAIRALISDWSIVHGKAEALDVAMATDKHRMALTGGINFIDSTLNDVTVALIDAKGCPKVMQTIRGTIEAPVIEKPNILKALAGPALRVLKKTTEILPGGECQVFYRGGVAHP